MAPALSPSSWGVGSSFAAALSTMAPQQQPQQQQWRQDPKAVAVHAAINQQLGKVVPAAPAEPIKLYSREYYITCALGGIVSCGATHTAVTPVSQPAAPCSQQSPLQGNTHHNPALSCPIQLRACQVHCLGPAMPCC
jgi:hypothetical protein